MERSRGGIFAFLGSGDGVGGAGTADPGPTGGNRSVDPAKVGRAIEYRRRGHESLSLVPVGRIYGGARPRRQNSDRRDAHGRVSERGDIGLSRRGDERRRHEPFFRSGRAGARLFLPEGYFSGGDGHHVVRKFSLGF